MRTWHWEVVGWPAAALHGAKLRGPASAPTLAGLLPHPTTLTALPAGIYQHSFEAAQNARHGFPVYSVNIEANHVQKKGDQYSAARLTDDDKAEIRALAREANIGGCSFLVGCF